jgi:hypothetical protein
MPQPSAPLRLSFFAALHLLHSIQTHYHYDPIGVRPWHLPFWLMGLFLIVHFPSISSTKSCRSGSIALAVHLIHHAMLDSVILAIVEAAGWPAAGWTVAQYLALYYAYRIHTMSRTMKRSTLSPAVLSAAVAVCVPIILASHAAPSSCAYAHLFAWTVADISSFLHPAVENVAS